MKIEGRYDKIDAVMDVCYYMDKISKEMNEKFEILCDFLLEYNEKVNLTSIKEKNEVFIKHFLDSVLGEKLFFKGANVIEIGSGGGFPSLPLKILRDDLNFTLVESTGKKCNYLNSCVDKLALNGVKVVNARAEEMGKDEFYREKYDCATARAVARLNTLCEYCMPFVKIGGYFIAYKGECDEELKEAEKAVKVLGGEIVSVENYSLPTGDKRTLICIKKVCATPKKYPRGLGKERKCPIV